VNRKLHHVPFPISLFESTYIQQERLEGWSKSTISKPYAYAFWANLYLTALNYPPVLDLYEPRHQQINDSLNILLQIWVWLIPYAASDFVNYFAKSQNQLTQDWTKSYAKEFKNPTPCKCCTPKDIGFDSKEGWKPSLWAPYIVWSKWHIDAFDADMNEKRKITEYPTKRNIQYPFQPKVKYQFKTRFEIFHFIYQLELKTNETIIEARTGKKNRAAVRSAFGANCKQVHMYFENTMRSSNSNLNSIKK